MELRQIGGNGAPLTFQASFSPPKNGIIISQLVDHFSGGIPTGRDGDGLVRGSFVGSVSTAFGLDM